MEPKHTAFPSVQPTRGIGGRIIMVLACTLAPTTLREVAHAPWEGEERTRRAYEECKSVVGRRIETMSDVAFAMHDDVNVNKFVNDRYSIESFVDGTDRIGLRRRQYFFCVIQPSPAGWHLVYLEIH